MTISCISKMSSLKSTTGLLKRLRTLMNDTKYVRDPISAYIVPTNDAHTSEYIADADKRREFISGFSGSAGTAIVTLQDARLWTDGRYYLQASQELDSNWKLMKDGLPDTPSQVWLSKNLPQGAKIGVDPKFITYREWVSLQKHLESSGQELVSVENNLIDLIWDNKPKTPNNQIIPLDRKYTGKSVLEKLKEINKQMTEKGVGALVLTALDEVAWFLNLRGSDIEYNPVFFAYVVVLQEDFVLFINKQSYTNNIDNHLKHEAPGITFKVESYDQIGNYLETLAENLKESVWFYDESNSYLVRLLDKKKVFISDMSPVSHMKAVKNQNERKGMRNSHIKDAVALCSYFEWLEREIASGNNVTEISGAKKLEEFRSQQEDFAGPSFETISSVGPHGAIIHYAPNEKTDVLITDKELYLCDSGGQYLDGTTDVTRTLHFGTPTDHEKQMFTLVLKGQLQLGSIVFPKKVKGNRLDAFARQFLWKVGLDYNHGTGHGVGSYLNVHEGPMGIHKRDMRADPGLEEGMFLSNEPGYYENGKFGIRIEDVVEIVPATTPYNFENLQFYTFNTITLVPKQTKLIKTEMLTDEEILTLNNYHQKCRDVLGPILKTQKRFDVKKWLWKETEPISK
ncbi:xaa-Pro aminopeptidase ApepP isoform X2 [Agrilus planipennis]|uniref:Xaa-Pro aminopeptidase ApepP isoform X2 n=2 Tax=Agrilus planipennis TaxID=224129 RepID=A0A7F5RD75_AGRPL|nr:xaa-Pro aminopeptidase ApepP isoform X2 [Agrilus planipennis]